MADGAEAEDIVPVDQLTPEEASRIIHSHCKVRYGTACWPCRQRKVKCDNKQPCENCVKRDHAQLCSYKPNRSSVNKHASALAQNAYPRKRAQSFEDGRDDGHKVERQDSWPRCITNLDDTEPGGDCYLGQNSIPVLLRDQSSLDGRSDNHLHYLTRDISAELPSDSQVIKLFQIYKNIPQPFWGFVYDMDELESKMMLYLEDRSRTAPNTLKSSCSVTTSWLAILFAVLAVGSQYRESSYQVRTRDSQRYIQISFHFLRLGNFLLRPSLDSIQALLFTGFVLLNDMKAEASWALTGLTCLLAQSLGLHRTGSSENASPALQSAEMARRQLWWTCVWHDTLTSLSFDTCFRCPMTSFPSCDIPMKSSSSPGGYSYLERMYHLIEIISRRLNVGVTDTPTYNLMVDNCESLETLRKKCRAHMQNVEKCKTAMDHLQYYAIRLHTSFVISVACRPALRRDCELDPHQKKKLANRCKENLMETVRMFLAMHQLSIIPTRSWAFTYHGLSSALLLGIICKTKTDPEMFQLQGDLIAALSATAAKDATSTEASVPQVDRDIELSGPLWRALTALKNIYNHGTVVGSSLKKGELAMTASGSQTLLPLGNQMQVIPTSQLRNPQSESNPGEDAAVDMAEMERGTSLQDFSGLSYVPAVPTVGLDDVSAFSLDQTQFMAPMDLYNSIWRESSQRWNSDLDALSFDFLQ